MECVFSYAHCNIYIIIEREHIIIELNIWYAHNCHYPYLCVTCDVQDLIGILSVSLCYLLGNVSVTMCIYSCTCAVV